MCVKLAKYLVKRFYVIICELPLKPVCKIYFASIFPPVINIYFKRVAAQLAGLGVGTMRPMGAAWTNLLLALEATVNARSRPQGAGLETQLVRQIWNALILGLGYAADPYHLGGHLIRGGHLMYP